MKNALKIALITIVLIVVILVLIGGYFGLVPGVSNIFGSNKPRDLGVTYTEQDRLAGRAKIGWQLQNLAADLPPEQSLKYSGQKPVTASFNNKELTAWINKSWEYIPVTDAEIRVNPDGTAEISGILHTDRIASYAQAMGGGSGQIDDLVGQYGKYLTGTPTIYMKATGSVVNNVVSAQVYELQIGRFSVPSAWLSTNQGSFIKAAQWQIRSIPGLSIKSLTFKNGTANFDGTMPAVISRSVSK